MFFGMCIHETLYEDGRLESIIITPSKSTQTLITDNLADVGPNYSRDVDIATLRFYIKENGLDLRTTTTYLTHPNFKSTKKNITFNISHRHWPLPDSHAGYYILTLPNNFSGNVNATGNDCTIKFMTDANQQLISTTVYPRNPSIHIRGDLTKGATPPPNAELTTTHELLKSNLPGIHYTPVDNILKALQLHKKECPSAFLCHSSDNKPEARRLAIALATRGINPWIDEAEIRTGDSLIEKIENGIAASNCLIPILSKSSVNSRWCREELRMALTMQIQNGIKGVLPVLIENCTIPGFLIEKKYVDLTSLRQYDANVNRLAADIHDINRKNDTI